MFVLYCLATQELTAVFVSSASVLQAKEKMERSQKCSHLMLILDIWTSRKINCFFCVRYIHAVCFWDGILKAFWWHLDFSSPWEPAGACWESGVCSCLRKLRFYFTLPKHTRCDAFPSDLLSVLCGSSSFVWAVELGSWGWRVEASRVFWG